jgi:Uma2 family endonuclease
MADLPDLITVAQYRQLPEDAGCKYELRRGEVVPVSFPKQGHSRLQKRLVLLLEPGLPNFSVEMGFAFRALHEFELRGADVSAIARERFVAIDADDNLYGAPELVIEIKSPSNTKRELQEKASLCLANGTIEFWILERDPKSVTVIQRNGSRQTFGMADTLSLAAFGGSSLSVAEIFS